MGDKTDQDQARQVGDRLAPPTTPNSDSIAEDRKMHDKEHESDRMPTAEEEGLADTSEDLDPEVARKHKEAIERGAALEGEGKPGV